MSSSLITYWAVVNFRHHIRQIYIENIYAENYRHDLLPSIYVGKHLLFYALWWETPTP